MDVLFLDANVLYSAAYRADAGVARLWQLEETTLLTSGYALEEARRSLERPEQRARLDELTKAVEVSEAIPDVELPPDVVLPAKDRPILTAALAAGATHLITGDQTHFGRLFGCRIGITLVTTPAAYLAQRGTHG
ncbi:MAG: PIN domain-containing protein [Gemmatimonadetes bacterium]|nr:PIN domain-containing protein [Gemmatimonadota bacterium]